MEDNLKDIEQCYYSFLETENKEDLEKVMSDLFNDLQSIDAYNLLV